MKTVSAFLAFLFLPAFVPAQDANQAKIVVYRPDRHVAVFNKPSVYLDSRQLARLANGRYFEVFTSPGKHVVTSSMKKHDPLHLDLRPGETAYLEMILLSGNWQYGGRLIPTSKEDAEVQIKKLKPLDAKWITSPGATAPAASPKRKF